MITSLQTVFLTHSPVSDEARMAGAIIENMSGRKLAMVGGVLVVCQVTTPAVNEIS